MMGDGPRLWTTSLSAPTIWDEEKMQTKTIAVCYLLATAHSGFLSASFLKTNPMFQKTLPTQA